MAVRPLYNRALLLRMQSVARGRRLRATEIWGVRRYDYIHRYGWPYVIGLSTRVWEVGRGSVEAIVITTWQGERQADQEKVSWCSACPMGQWCAHTALVQSLDMWAHFLRQPIE